MKTEFGGYELDDERARFDFARCHRWLSTAYWSEGITRAEVEHGFVHSTLVVGAYNADQQTDCLRVLSDRTRFAYLMDVFVDPAFRGLGLGTAMLRFVLAHPELALVYKWTLATADAHEVYRDVGFSELPNPEQWMFLSRPRPWIHEPSDAS